jgi:alpha-glucoside transport system substrate-binding protein
MGISKTSGRGRRRLATAAAGIAAVALALTGCASGGGGDTGGDAGGGAAGDEFAGETLNVAAAWSGAEQQNFEAVLAEFEHRTGAKVNYTSFGDNGPTYIRGQLEGGSPPNVAVLGQPALMQSLAEEGDILPVGDAVRSAVEENYSESWIDLGSVDGELYGVWFKAANKSTVWYNADIYDEAGAVAPEDWDDFLTQLGLVSDAGYAGISIGADVGWPLTDWFENVYLRTAGPEMYDQLANHEIPWTDDSVIEALDALAEVWGNDSLLLSGGGQMSFPDSVTAVFQDDPAAGTVFEGDFVAGNIADQTNAVVGEDALFYPWPSMNDSPPTVMGAGNVAVAFDEDEGTQALMQYLASPEAANIWIERGGFTSPNQNSDLDLYPDDVSLEIAQNLVDAEVFRFDLSDLTPSAFGGTEGEGMWQILIGFFEDPSDPAATAQELEDAAVSAYGE